MHAWAVMRSIEKFLPSLGFRASFLRQRNEAQEPADTLQSPSRKTGLDTGSGTKRWRLLVRRRTAVMAGQRFGFQMDQHVADGDKLFQQSVFHVMPDVMTLGYGKLW